MSSIRKTQGMNAQPGDFPGGLAVKTPPSNAGGVVGELLRSHMPWVQVKKFFLIIKYVNLKNEWPVCTTEDMERTPVLRIFVTVTSCCSQWSLPDE